MNIWYVEARAAYPGIVPSVQDVRTLAERVRLRDPIAVARAISVVENGSQGTSDALVRALRPGDAHAFMVGVTGPPGAGKSTLVDRLISEFRALGQRVGVLAVDPTSPFSGGAVLGDRIRMQTHTGDDGVFVRSLATRGEAGGVSRATAAAATVLAAAGFDVVIIETVGVGQSEVSIADIADVSIVVLVPGAGDDVQALKAGILEIADLIVVNKADREGADALVAALRAATTLDDSDRSQWTPAVITTVATTGAGVRELVAALDGFHKLQRPRRQRLGSPEPVSPSVAIDHIGVAMAGESTLETLLDMMGGLQAGDAEEVTDAGVRVRFVETAGARVELIEPISADSPVASFLERRGSGLHHVALRVADLDGMLARLQSAGVRLIDATPRPGAHGTRIAFVHPSSAGGVLLELVEPREGG